MALKRLISVLPVLLIVLTGCLKQASPPVEVVAEAQPGAGFIPLEAPTDTPDPDEIMVIINTPIAPTDPEEEPEQTDQPDIDEETIDDDEDFGLGDFSVDEEEVQEENTPLPPPSSTPTPVVIPVTNTPAVTSTPLPEIVLLTATPIPTGTPQSAVDPVMLVTSTPFVQQPVITPGSPLSGQSAIVTPTAAAEQAVTSDDGISATSTPSGLVTPTDAFFPDQPPDEACIYTVRTGDTLFRIALNNNTTVSAIQQANPNINPNVIRPGQEITLPDCNRTPTPIPPASGQTDVEDGGISAGLETVHIVQSGDTLGAIARRYGVTVNAIVSRNNLSNPNQLSVGQQLTIPAPGG